MKNMINEQGGRSHPLRVAATEVGNLAYEAINKGFSLRLLAALMDTRSYGVVYQSMISSQRGRGGVRGPTCRSDKTFLEKNARHLLSAMEIRGITPRRWCSAYSLELQVLFNPQECEMDYDRDILGTLKEDFPDAYGIEAEPYLHAYVEMQGYEHIFCRKKHIHLYKTSSGLTMASKSNGKALALVGRVQGLKYQAQRLKVLLALGPEAALAWVPSLPADFRLALTEKEKEILDLLKRDTAVNDLIDRLAALPRQYLSNGEVKLEEECLKQLASHGMNPQQIETAIKSVRLKAGIY